MLSRIHASTYPPFTFNLLPLPLKKMTLLGIDYGSKLAGTTVIAYYPGEEVLFFQSEKKKDADAFVLEKVEAFGPCLIGLDAPLSLPGVFRGIAGCKDYAYRAGDRELRAMSPMFIGGLSARAIRLKDELERPGCRIFETYPAEWARRLELASLNYKKEKGALPAVAAALQAHIQLPFEAEDITSWHHLDSLLCLWSAFRYSRGMAQSFGKAEEGLIWI
jgi:predicted nuclease with RNAse H fold